MAIGAAGHDTGEFVPRVDGSHRRIAATSPVDYQKVVCWVEHAPALLRKLIAEYAATGVPPAYLPKDECKPDEKDDR